MGAAVASSEVLPQIFRRKATVVASSMASWGESCQQAGGESLERLARFRRELYWCLWRCRDALFELADAVLTAAGPVASLPYLSLEPAFRRGYGMVCRSLGEGGIDEEALRDLLVAARPRDWPLAFATGASACPRPEAECSPNREFHHHSCAGFHSSDGAAIAGCLTSSAACSPMPALRRSSSRGGMMSGLLTPARRHPRHGPDEPARSSLSRPGHDRAGTPHPHNAGPGSSDPL